MHNHDIHTTILHPWDDALRLTPNTLSVEECRHEGVCILLFAADDDNFITRNCMATNYTSGCFSLEELYGRGDINPSEPQGIRGAMLTGTGCLCATDLCDPDTPSDWSESNENGQKEHGQNDKQSGQNDLTDNTADSSGSRQSSVTHGLVVLSLPVLSTTQQVRAQFH